MHIYIYIYIYLYSTNREVTWSHFVRRSLHFCFWEENFWKIVVIASLHLSLRSMRKEIYMDIERVLYACHKKPHMEGLWNTLRQI